MRPLSNEIRDRLRAPFPAEAVTQQESKPFLSTLKAIYVVERLNDVFGIGGWQFRHELVADDTEYVTVSGQLSIPEPWGVSTPIQYGGHRKTGKGVEPADGYKSAVTDCLSKCASYLEVGIDVFKGKAPSGKAGGGGKPRPQGSAPGKGRRRAAQGGKSREEISFLQLAAEFKKRLGAKTYYDLLHRAGYDHANEIPDRESRIRFYNLLVNSPAAREKSSGMSPDPRDGKPDEEEDDFVPGL